MTSSTKTLLIGLTFVVASAVPTFAAPVPNFGTVNVIPSDHLGTLTPDSINDSANYAFKTTGAFSQTFDFVLSVASTLSLSYTASYSNPKQIINPFNIALFDSTGMQVDSGIGTVYTDRVGGALSDTLAAGAYSFNINGKSGDFPSVGGTLTVSSVPLPASAPMFGAALLALGAVGYGVKRRKAAAAV